MSNWAGLIAKLIGDGINAIVNDRVRIMTLEREKEKLMTQSEQLKADVAMLVSLVAAFSAGFQAMQTKIDTLTQQAADNQAHQPEDVTPEINQLGDALSQMQTLADKFGTGDQPSGGTGGDPNAGDVTGQPITEPATPSVQPDHIVPPGTDPASPQPADATPAPQPPLTDAVPDAPRVGDEGPLTDGTKESQPADVVPSEDPAPPVTGTADEADPVVHPATQEPQPTDPGDDGEDF